MNATAAEILCFENAPLVGMNTPLMSALAESPFQNRGFQKRAKLALSSAIGSRAGRPQMLVRLFVSWMSSDLPSFLVCCALAPAAPEGPG